MLAKPILEFDLDKIYENAVKVQAECDKHGLTANFIVKGFRGAWEIIETVKRAGINRFGDSRLLNIMKLKEKHPDTYVVLIRTPSPTEAEEVVRFADASLESEAETVAAISKEAVRQGKIHDIYLDIDVGDLRDGVFGREKIDAFVKKIKDLPGINIIGVFANVGCVGSVMPDETNTNNLADVKDYLNDNYGLNIERVSFGGTVAFSMVQEGSMPERINEFRFGEVVLFGEDTTGNREIKGFNRDTVMFSAPVIEKQIKPSYPIGTLGLDACGNPGEYIDRGIRKRIILAAGKQDVDAKALTPIDAGMIYIGSSSDHMVFDVEEAVRDFKIGEYVALRCGYMAMLSAVTSEYVEKRYIRH